MFKKLRIISVFIVIWSADVQACLQTIAIPAKNFRAGNSLIIITRDHDGIEQVSGCVSFDETKTQYSQEEISQYHIALGSIKEQPEAILSDVQPDQNASDSEAIVYLYFEVDTHLDIIRVLIIKNSLLADNPFDVMRFTTSQLFGDDDDDWNDFADSDLPVIDPNKKIAEPAQLSYCDAVILASYLAWAYGQAQAQQIYSSTLEWFKSKYAE